MNTNTKTLARISGRRAERLLMELANLLDDAGSAQRLKVRFPELTLIDDPKLESDDEFEQFVKDQTGIEYWEFDLRCLRDDLRRVWREPDRRTREYLLFLLQKKALERNDKISHGASISSLLPSPLPSPTQFEQAIVYFRRANDRAHYCRNPDCLAPYFFANRRNQKYCSDACAKTAQREFKRQWWAEHGEEWRAGREAQNRAKNRSKKGAK